MNTDIALAVVVLIELCCIFIQHKHIKMLDKRIISLNREVNGVVDEINDFINS